MIHQHRRSKQMVHRDVEKTLYLRRMRVDNQSPVSPRRGQQIGHQLRRNRSSRLILAILPRVPVIRNHRRDAPRRSAFQRVDHQQQLHQVFVHRPARRLHHKHVAAPHVLLNLDVHLAVGETLQHGLATWHAEEVTNFIGQRLVRRTAENLELLVHPRSRLAFRFFLGRGGSLLLGFLRLFRFRGRHQSGHS